jgi:hypothetical protein
VRYSVQFHPRDASFTMMVVEQGRLMAIGPCSVKANSSG